MSEEAKEKAGAGKAAHRKKKGKKVRGGGGGFLLSPKSVVAPKASFFRLRSGCAGNEWVRLVKISQKVFDCRLREFSLG